MAKGNNNTWRTLGIAIGLFVSLSTVNVVLWQDAKQGVRRVEARVERVEDRLERIRSNELLHIQDEIKCLRERVSALEVRLNK